MSQETRRTRSLSDDEAFNEIINIQPAVDRVRFATIRLADNFSAAKKKSLLRQEKAAAARHGPGAPQTKTLRRRVEAEERFATAVKAEGQRGQVEPLSRNDEALTMRGRVVDERRGGIAHLTVSAIDEEGKAVNTAASSKTGYYEFLVPAGKKDHSVSLLVSDSRKNILFRGCESFRVRARAVVTRELVLGKRAPGTPPTPPPVVDPKKVTVPDVLGWRLRDAERKLEAFCLKPRAVTEPTSPDRIGKVLEQRPEPGTMAPLASQVTLKIGTAVQAPNVVGLAQEEAQAKLAELGFSLGSIEFTPAPTDQTGTVIRQSPEGGSIVDPGATINLVIGRIEKGRPVPKVIDQSLREARATIHEAGFLVGTVDPPDAPPESKVIGQKPKLGKLAPARSAIDLKVRPKRESSSSSGGKPPTVEVPKVVDLSLVEARQVLEEASLVIGKVSPSKAAPESVVIRQKPGAEADVPENSSVNLWITEKPPKKKRRAAKKTAKRKRSRRTAENNDESR